MRVHRFFVPEDIELSHDFWLHNQRLLWQWRKVLRMQPGQEVVLFDGLRHERLYRIAVLKDNEAHLQHVTDFERKTPSREVYLFWSLLKKDKNEWVLQKGTELGVSHFVPLLADRSEKLGFDIDRAQKIMVEAAEQCGRSDIPAVREPITPHAALQEFSGRVKLFICEQGSDSPSGDQGGPVGVLVGPEGGWSDEEKNLFAEKEIPHIGLGQFTLRAETATIVAVSLLGSDHSRMAERPSLR